MDTGLLVETQIDEGQRLLDQLSRDDFEVAVALWLRTSEESPWHFYIASPKVNAESLGIAYQALYDSLRKLPNCWIQFSDIKLISDSNPIARDAIEIRNRGSLRLATRYGGKRLGDVSIEQAYIYPEPIIKGFDEIKRQYPSAEIFMMPISSGGQAPTNLLQTVMPFIGKVNEPEFEGKAPGTLLCMGIQSKSGKPQSTLIFVYRPEGWNKMFRPDTKSWEEVFHAATGKPIYESADFSALAAMKIGS